MAEKEKDKGKEKGKEKEKEAAPAPDKKEAAAKAEAPAVEKKAKEEVRTPETKCAIMIEKYFAGAILFSIFVVIVSGFGAGVSFYEVLYRCVIISMVLWAISYAARKYCRLLTSFKSILEEMKKDTAVTLPEE